MAIKFNYKRNSVNDWRNFLFFKEQIQRFVENPKDKLILDAGCGKRAGQVLLFHNFGYRITGIDLNIPERYRPWERAPFPLNIHLGLGRIKRLAIEYYLFRRYYKSLERLSGRKLSFKGLDVRTMDICHTHFPHGYFDIVISIAVFEHIHDVAAACKELKRITRRGGYLFIDIHLFTSLSGGHHHEWREPLLVKQFTIPPWDHLRSQIYPVDPSLNQLRMGSYKKIFNENFKIVDWVWNTSEAESCRKFLTPRIREELSNYSEEELLNRSFLAVLRN